MRKILLSLILAFIGSTPALPSQENSIIVNEVKKANSTTFSKIETISLDNKISILELQSFDFDLGDFKSKEEIEFNFELKKKPAASQAYFVFILDKNKELWDTLTISKMDVFQEEVEVSAKFNVLDLEGIGNDFYIRIGAHTIESIPFFGIVHYIDLPLSNIWDLVFESNELSYITRLSYNTKSLKVYREYLHFLNIEQDVYIDTYESFFLNSINCDAISNDNFPSRYCDIYLYIHDPKHLFYDGFPKIHDKYQDYAGTPLFFSSTSNNNMSTLRSNIIFYVNAETLTSHRSKPKDALYFRSDSAIYFPIHHYDTFKETKCNFTISNYGDCGAKMEYWFTLHFSPNFAYETFYVEMVDSVKDWNYNPEEIFI